MGVTQGREWPEWLWTRQKSFRYIDKPWIKDTLKREGRWAEFVSIRESLKARGGQTMAEIWRQAFIQAMGLEPM
jgi:hypothetical protein